MRPLVVKLLALVAAVLALATAASADAPATPGAVPPAVRKAADLWERSTHGVIAFDRTVDFTLRAGPVKYHEHNDATLVLVDGVFAKIKVATMTRDGHDLGDDARLKFQTKTEKDWAAGKGFLRPPYDPRYLQEYSYDKVAPAPDGPAGTMVVSFSSPLHDEEHGTGDMTIDPAGHVLRLTYTPNVMPSHATSATTTQYSEEVLPGVWLVTRVEGQFSGRIMAFGGNATLDEVESHFRRFSSMVAATAAIGSQ